MQFHLDGFIPGDPDISLPAQNPARTNAPNKLPQNVDVLVAGCGPAGLCLTAQLAKFPQISTMIVEPKPGPLELGQADGISVRSMEMFQAFGFADKVSREGLWINETTFWKPDPKQPEHIHRIGQVQDVADGLSEMPHVLLNQARVHDMYLDVMRHSASRLEPDYCLQVVDATVDNKNSKYPVKVTLQCTDAARKDQMETVRARYVVGCDGARSTVRKAMGASLHGDAAHQAWGVIDVLAVTDFPDVRMKCVIQSNQGGSVIILPREGGYLVRYYVELDALGENERAKDRGLGIDDVIAKAQAILKPHRFDVKEVVWWSIYEIGHRITDKFDDAAPTTSDSRDHPHIFIAGDACHTHSPKAGQGMNVSMGDTFNLGWKLISVLTGRADSALLQTYSAERRAAAEALIEFDHKWSRVIGAAPEEDADDNAIPKFQREFIRNLDYTSGLTIHYTPSSIIGSTDHQDLASGFPVGKRFHSAPVIRLADAKPMHLGHVIETGFRWTLFVFSPNDDTALRHLCDSLADDPSSIINTYHREGDEIDALFDIRAIYQQEFREIDFENLHPLLRPAKGRYALTDYEKVYCADMKSGDDIFTMRGINRQQGCVVIVRPDQYVANVLPITAHNALTAFFKGVFNE